MEKLGVGNVKTLLVLEEQDSAVTLSSRNLQKSMVTTADKLNSYDVLHAQKLLISEGAVKLIEEGLVNTKKK